VLLLGPSGTGKTVFARHIHRLSERKDRDFIPMDCGTLQPSLQESQLFGHLKGAFTGADAESKGYFEQADGGTVFLEEVGNLTQEAQMKLLTVLRERRIRPLGSNKDLFVDVRVIAATNANLKDKIAAGQFRDDLFYRLSEFPITLPGLAERREDIPELAMHYLEEQALYLKKHVRRIDPEAMQLMMQYSWPGNVGELINVINRAVILANADTITKLQLPEEIARSKSEAGSENNSPTPNSQTRFAAFERQHLETALKLGGEIKDVLARLRIDRRTLHSKAGPYGLDLNPRPALKVSDPSFLSLDDAIRAFVFNAWKSLGENVAQTARHLGIDEKTVRRKLKSKQRGPN
jgi:DNA-binding NtrC family response regulator